MAENNESLCLLWLNQIFDSFPKNHETEEKQMPVMFILAFINNIKA